MRIRIAVDANFVKPAPHTRDCGVFEFTTREIFQHIGWVRKVAVFFRALATLVLVGPFGNYSDLVLTQRLSFWTVTLSGVGFFMHVGMRAAMTAKITAGISQYLQIAIGSALAAIPGAAVVVFVDNVFRGLGAEDAFVFIAIQVSVIGLVIGLVEYVDWHPHESPIETSGIAAVEPDSEHQVRLMDHLSPANRGDFISLSMQDHYVKVITSNGAELVLLRFADALDEVSGADGLRLHRSHWAVRRHIQRSERKRGRQQAILSDGRVLPISATYADAVEQSLR